MNTYLVTLYNYGYEGSFRCLYLVDPETKYITDNKLAFFKIIDVIISHNDMIHVKGPDGFYKWKFYEHSQEHDGLYKEDRGDLIELPDNESALLWFEMNY